MQASDVTKSKLLSRKLSEPIKAALLIAGALLIAAYIHGGRYTTRSAASGLGVFVLDRWTGVLQWCNVNACTDVQQKR